jgi:hypothetical protein
MTNRAGWPSTARKPTATTAKKTANKGNLVPVAKGERY